jgi:DNA-binding CsgD family transcriptional regulator
MPLIGGHTGPPPAATSDSSHAPRRKRRSSLALEHSPPAAAGDGDGGDDLCVQHSVIGVRGRWPSRGDVALAVGLAVVVVAVSGLAAAAAPYRPADGFSVTVAALAALALAWRRVRPVWAVAGTGAAVVLLTAAGYDATRAATAGRSSPALVAPSVTRRLLRRLSGRHAPDPSRRRLLDELTGRELEVLGLLAEGRSNSEIAALLYLSPETVKSHIKRILAKTGLRDRTQAVVFAFRSGFAPLG